MTLQECNICGGKIPYDTSTCPHCHGHRKLEWVEGPPPVTRAGGKAKGGRTYVSESAQLIAKPGQWAILRRDFKSQDQAATLASYIRIGQLAAFSPSGAFEAVSRSVEGEYRVYARYVGGPVYDRYGGDVN